MSCPKCHLPTSGGLALYAMIPLLVFPLTGCGLGPTWQSSDPATIAGWIGESIQVTIPDGYEPKHGFNFLPGGIKIKIATILPVSQKSPEGKVPADLCTAFELILCPEVSDTPDLGGAYYYHRMKYDLGRPPTRTPGTPVRITCGQKTVKAWIFEWDDNGTTIARYHVFPNDNVEVVAVGPKNRFDDLAFQSLLRSMNPEEAVKY